MGEARGSDLLSAAVSPLVAVAVAGPAGPRRVLAAFPTCVYLELGEHHDVLALLAADALQLPIGLRLALPASSVCWGVAAGDQVVVGAGRVQLPRHQVVAARLARHSRVRPAAVTPTAAGVANLPEPGLLGELCRDLTDAALVGRPLGAALHGLVGAGRGLTPSGDDALCGVLLALCAVDHPRAVRALSDLRFQLRPLLSRTTSLSAALVVAAGAGYAVPDVVRLVTHLQTAGSSNRAQAAYRPGDGGFAADGLSVDPAVERVLAIGHTSGPDLLSGVAGAWTAMAEVLDVSDSLSDEGADRA